MFPQEIYTTVKELLPYQASTVWVFRASNIQLSIPEEITRQQYNKKAAEGMLKKVNNAINPSAGSMPLYMNTDQCCKFIVSE